MSLSQVSPVPIPGRRRRPHQDTAILSARELDAVVSLVGALENAAPTGAPLLTLAEDSGLEVADTVRLLKRHGDYFVACGDTGKFRLNAFGPFAGDAGHIRDHARRKFWRVRWALFFVVLGMLVGLLLRGIA